MMVTGYAVRYMKVYIWFNVPFLDGIAHKTVKTRIGYRSAWKFYKWYILVGLSFKNFNQIYVKRNKHE